MKVTAKGATGTLTADVTTARGTRNDVAFADLDLTKADWTTAKGVVTLANVPAKPTADGAARFAGPNGTSFYRPGAAVDPVTPTLSADAGAAVVIAVRRHALGS
nr:HtaA domain-containing protein [Streptomyces sp. SS]